MSTDDKTTAAIADAIRRNEKWRQLMAENKERRRYARGIRKQPKREGA